MVVRVEWLEVVKMKKEIVIVIVLIALVIITGIQAFQLNNIKEKLVNGETYLSSYNDQGNQQDLSGGNNVPVMVGGC